MASSNNRSHTHLRSLQDRRCASVVHAIAGHSNELNATRQRDQTAVPSEFLRCGSALPWRLTRITVAGGVRFKSNPQAPCCTLARNPAVRRMGRSFCYCGSQQRWLPVWSWLNDPDARDGSASRKHLGFAPFRFTGNVRTLCGKDCALRSAVRSGVARARVCSTRGLEAHDQAAVNCFLPANACSCDCYAQLKSVHEPMAGLDVSSGDRYRNAQYRESV